MSGKILLINLGEKNGIDLTNKDSVVTLKYSCTFFIGV